MGGMSSTRWNGVQTRRQVDGSYRIIAPPAWMVEQGQGVYRWPKSGFVVYVDIRPERSPVAALLRFNLGDGMQAAALASTPSNLRVGSRWWWLCPECDRRCLKLYFPPRAVRFACRLCHDLSYESAQASRQRYYELFKASARHVQPRGPQREYLRSVGIRPMTATYFRERCRARLGGFTVAPYEGIPEPLNETKRDTLAE
jgi:hypothetical protein